MLKKLFKTLFSIVAVLGLVLTAGTLLLPSDFHVERRLVVAAAPGQVYEQIADPRQWKAWSVWTRRDPAMQITYEGPPSGVGAAWSWRSATEGDGRMSFKTAEPGRLLGYELFFPDFGTTSRGELRLAAAAGGTEVTWTMTGNMGTNPMFRWIALFADRMVGRDFETSLEGLRQVVERR